MRLNPAQATSGSSLDSMEAALRPLLQAEFARRRDAQLPLPASFGLQLNARAHTSFDRMAAINRLAKLVQPCEMC